MGRAKITPIIIARCVTGMDKTADKGTILVVDDVATNRRVVRAIVNSAGFSVVECDSARKCLEEVCQMATEGQLPLAILLDIMMPEMDGLELCRVLRRDYSREVLPVIIVTTRSGGRDLAEGLEAGANDYITKPIDRTVFLARLESQLTLGEYNRKLRAQRVEIERALDLQNAMGDAIPDAVAIVEKEGNLVYSNEALRRSMDGATAGNIKDIFKNIFGGEFRDKLEELSVEISGSPEKTIDREIEVRAPCRRVLNINSRPFEISGQSESLRLFIFRDRSTWKEIERQLAHRIKLEMVSVFASGVSHNFNNIFSSILGATELLEKVEFPEKRAERYLAIIKKAVLAGASLSRKMSGLVRRGKDRRDSGNIRSVVHDCVQKWQESHGGRINFLVSLPDCCPAVNLCDENLFEIADNIVSNAVDATPSGGEIKIEVRGATNSGMVTLAVIDNGFGMSEKVQSRLFEPFFTTKAVEAESGVSTMARGLGLWNVFNLLIVSGGEIDIKSDPGKGTEVTMNFLTL